MRADAIAPPPARRVRRLHLRAPAAEDASRAATLLADALSTASWPVADQGRLIVIRRLALGRISSAVSAASLALHIERAAQEVISEAVSCDLPEARDAHAVVCASRGDGIIMLARLHARQAPTDGWFWPSVVPGWRTDLSNGDRWRRLIDAAHSVPEAALVAAAIIAQAVAADVHYALLASVAPGDGATWLRREGWSVQEPNREATRPRFTDRHHAIVDRWRARWGVDDRLVWLATMLMVGERPACAADQRLPGSVAGALQRAVEPRAARADHAVPTDLDSPNSRSTRDSQPSAGPHVSRAEGEGTPWAGPGPSDGVRDIAQREVDQYFDATPVDWGTRPRVFTPHGGLLFLVPVLERLGFAEYVASRPDLLEAAFPARLLRFVGRRAGLAADDPLALALTPHDDDEDHGFDSSFNLWLNAVRRWCRRHARMGLLTLIRRPGRMGVSRTHIDIAFELSQLDVRIRRVALDVDPGWVPWLGRVVTFTYRDDCGRSR